MAVGKKCQSASHVVTFAFLISMAVLGIGLGTTKFIFKNTDVTGLLVAVSGLCEVISAITTLRVLIYTNVIFQKQIIIISVGLGAYMITNLGFIVFYFLRLHKDQSFIEWRAPKSHTAITWIVTILSGALSFKLFRVLYSKFLSLPLFSCKF